MEFFIALFGGLFLLVRYVARKTRKNALTRNDLVWKKESDIVKEKVSPDKTDDASVKEIMDTWSADDLFDYLEEDFTYVFGRDFRSVLPLHQKNYRDFSVRSPVVSSRGRAVFRVDRYVSIWIRRLLYSKRGKLDSLFGYEVLGDPDIEIGMFKRMEKNLNACGLDVHMQAGYEYRPGEKDKLFLDRKVYLREICWREWKGTDVAAIREFPCHYKAQCAVLLQGKTASDR